MLEKTQLDLYFERISYDSHSLNPSDTNDTWSLPPPNLKTLNDIQVRHTLSIPFENLSIFQIHSNPIFSSSNTSSFTSSSFSFPSSIHPTHESTPTFIPRRQELPLDEHSLFQKLVIEKRGGYCFEQNGLFLNVLLSLRYNAWGGLARPVKSFPIPHYNREGNGSDSTLNTVHVNEGSNIDKNKNNNYNNNHTNTKNDENQDNDDHVLQLSGPTHQIIFVSLNGKLYLVDVGWGGRGLRYPMEIYHGNKIGGAGKEEFIIVEGMYGKKPNYSNISFTSNSSICKSHMHDQINSTSSYLQRVICTKGEEGYYLSRKRKRNIHNHTNSSNSHNCNNININNDEEGEHNYYYEETYFFTLNAAFAPDYTTANFVTSCSNGMMIQLGPFIALNTPTGRVQLGPFGKGLKWLEYEDGNDVTMKEENEAGLVGSPQWQSALKDHFNITL